MGNAGTSESDAPFGNSGFVRTFVLPALWMFLVPLLALFFFRHVQSSFDRQARTAFIDNVNADPDLDDQDRAEALEFFRKVPYSEMILQPEVAQDVPQDVLWYYASFRWGIRLSLWALIGGAVVIVFAGVCLLLSTRSQKGQLFGLSAAWHALRIYSALAAILQAILAVGLSFWVTAFWFEMYVPKLILIVAVGAVFAVGTVLKGIFTSVPLDFTIPGDILQPQDAPRLWADLARLCETLGTEPPDNVVAGIDDSFFVTEVPAMVDGSRLEGRTLFVSLALLRQLDGTEADAVMAHEMAHFSGNDTLYSGRIAPMLAKFDRYLESLSIGGMTLPVFHFMHCFRALYALSMSRFSRQREFRADAVAAEVTSPRDIASALVKTVAFSRYRNEVERHLFDAEEVLESANISEQIDQGFRTFAMSFSTTENGIGELETSHPFDSHPPISARMEAFGLELNREVIDEYLAGEGDGCWYGKIRNAEGLERSQWSDYERAFRNAHEQSLAYRYLPKTDEEAEVVLRTFPNIEALGKEGSTLVTIFGVSHATWDGPLDWSQVHQCELDDNVLKIYTTEGTTNRILLGRLQSHKPAEFLEIFQNYFARYLTARDYTENTA